MSADDKADDKIQMDPGYSLRRLTGPANMRVFRLALAGTDGQPAGQPGCSPDIT